MFAGIFYVADSTFGRHGTCSFSFWALSLLLQREHRARVGNFFGGRPGARNATGPCVGFHLDVRHHDRYFGWTDNTHRNHTTGLPGQGSGWALSSAFERKGHPLRLPLFLHGWEEDGMLFPVHGQCTLADVLVVPRRSWAEGLASWPLTIVCCGSLLQPTVRRAEGGTALGH